MMLHRFIEAQQNNYNTALSEIKQGRKRSHWMWYVFPQIAGLGYSEMAKHYAIKNKQEAEAYLNHEVLGARLKEISYALLNLPSNNANEVMGSPDDMKLRSCMTLFSLVTNTDPVFEAVLDKFFSGDKDQATIGILDKATNA